MTTLTEQIKLAEKVWLKNSFSFLKEGFTKTPIPSHDHQHHIRVWLNSKFLLHQINELGIVIDYDFTEALLIASLFHDSGMLKTYGHDHGPAGRNICSDFIVNYKKKPALLDEILDAIEKHDDKTYMGPGPLIVDKNPNLLTALNISDDLDAFGHIGIYRYAEIYLMRGIPLEDIGLKIIANLAGRFKNFIHNCNDLPEMIRVHTPRFNQIEEFFRQYNLQLRQVESESKNHNSDPLSVVKIIYHKALMHQDDMENICKRILSQNEDEYILKFFGQLKMEIQDQNFEF